MRPRVGARPLGWDRPSAGGGVWPALRFPSRGTLSPMRSVLLALMLWLVCPNVARACVCVGAEPATDAEFQALVDGSAAVFEGRAGEPRWEGDFYVYPFEVLRSFKGPQGDSALVGTGGRREGRSFTGSSCDASFEEGRSYLVFGFLNESGQLSSWQCSPTRLTSEAGPYLKFLERPEPETEPPPIEPPSGCRASTRAPTELVAFALIGLLGLRSRRSSRQCSSPDPGRR